MARSRNIKPGFFTNEHLGELDPLARLLFAGLWCHADREGRLEDRLKRLKPQILPFDNCDIEALANSLFKKGFIQRYVVDGKGYIQISEFRKHQNPHMKEQPSTIPAPDKHQTSMSVAHLIPDSFNLIPDSFIKPLASSDESLSADAVIKIPVRGGEYPVMQDFVDTLAEAYPVVDVPQTLREIKAWCLSNPKKQKTQSGAKRFINSWCERIQNHG